ncbi:hypothetical protein O3G_MSEX006044 [Manduca sexta]|uniref:Gustatory receptor 11 isoform A n=2 Tax=Manduca sexta TaxID=7130 RepID=A0A5K8B191_MANSE|nr:hypothetical protein O3G_MSEX006044 [Manduca sexta]CUQ99352.1 TPA: Gustatory receptor 11 isoform A [Manduca sexta]
MLDIKAIKIFLFIENILCIYRNYTFYKKKTQKIVLFHVIITLSFCVAVVANDIYVTYEYFRGNLSTLFLILIYHFQFTVYTMLSIVCGISQSSSFEELINTLEKMHNKFKDDVYHANSLKKMNTHCILPVVYFIVLTLSVLYERMNYVFLDHLIVFDVLQYISEIAMSYCYLTQYFVYSLYLTIIYELFKRFYILLNEVKTKLDEKIVAGEKITDNINLKIIEEWAEMYGDLVKISKAFRKCFSGQNFKGKGGGVTMMMTMFFDITYHLTAVTTAMLAAQRVQNGVPVLKRILASFYNILTAYPNRPELGRIKNFSRMVAQNPLSTAEHRPPLKRATLFGPQLSLSSVHRRSYEYRRTSGTEVVLRYELYHDPESPHLRPPIDPKDFKASNTPKEKIREKSVLEQVHHFFVRMRQFDLLLNGVGSNRMTTTKDDYPSAVATILPACWNRIYTGCSWNAAHLNSRLMELENQYHFARLGIRFRDLRVASYRAFKSSDDYLPPWDGREGVSDFY